MGSSDSESNATDLRNPRRVRRDGWTGERQLAFLTVLGRTRSVTKAAAAAGMSRESAYRLRARRPGGLFATLWDRAVQAPRPIVRLEPGPGESHIGDADLMRHLSFARRYRPPLSRQGDEDHDSAIFGPAARLS